MYYSISTDQVQDKHTNTVNAHNRVHAFEKINNNKHE